MTASPTRSTPGTTLAGKVAVISGGASGIGLATGRRLAGEGASIVVVDRDEAAGTAAAAELAGRFVKADVGEPGDWSEVVRVAEETFGGIDIAFLNAGIVTPDGAELTEISDEAYRLAMRVNIDGVFFGARAVTPAIERRGAGAIVATASLAGLISYSPDPVYAANKHAVVGLVRALAPQLGAKGITVNAICPGLVDTPLLSWEAKSLVADAGFPLIAAEDIAEAVYGRVVGSDTGRAWVCQAGRPAIAYRFSGVPGPAGSAAGRTPPAELAAHDQVGRQ
jgi:NAD(P)-dependent dehydrogenase (short-subunit alcohol dehydrogenase family)